MTVGERENKGRTVLRKDLLSEVGRRSTVTMTFSTSQIGCGGGLHVRCVGFRRGTLGCCIQRRFKLILDSEV